MQIDRIYYPVKTLGPGNRIGIWTIGCTHRCLGCSNPELWDENTAKDISIDRIISYIETIKDAEGITITGGDPFNQLDDLTVLLHKLNNLGYEDILVYSGYTIEEILEMGELAKRAIDNIGVLIDGPYIDGLNDNKGIRGSSNQKIIVLNHSLDTKYDNVENMNRETQIVLNDNMIQAIGIPIK